jgi:hypothetical protein
VIYRIEITVCMCEVQRCFRAGDPERRGLRAGGSTQTKEIQAINLQLSKHSTKCRFEAIIRIIGMGALSPELSR